MTKTVMLGFNADAAPGEEYVPLAVNPDGTLKGGVSGGTGGRTDAIGRDKIRPGVLAVTSAADVHAGNEIPEYEHPTNVLLLSRVVIQPRGGDVWIGRAGADETYDAPGSDGRLLIPANTIYELDREEALQWCARAVSTDVILTYRVRYDGTPYTGD